MNLDAFLRERQQSWADLERLVVQARSKPERLGPAGVRELGARYRAAAADLAVARRCFPTDPAVPRLEYLVGRSRHLVYDSAVRRQSLVDFARSGYWRRLTERPRMLAVALLLLFGPAVFASAWALSSPADAARLVPGQFQTVTEPGRSGGDLGIPADRQAAFASAIFTNNIQVSFFAFAGGITGGLLTGVVLIFNGALLGVVGGLAFQSGNGRSFVELVTAHGVLELSCIAVAGLAGLRMGWALVAPGRRRRSEVLTEEARAAVEIVLGTAPWLVVAGLVEGFLTPSGLGLGPVLGIGFGLGTLYWGLALWRGRPATASPAPSS